MRTETVASIAISGAIALLLAVRAEAADIRVIGATPMTAIVKDAGGRFERETGHRLITKFVAGPVVKREIDGGEPFDLALSITPVIDALLKEGKIVAATRADVAYSGVGVGVRAGSPKPDIGTPDALKRALLDAKSVAFSGEGASGDYFRGLLARLGIAERMQSKLRPMASAALVKAVPDGQAEMIVVTTSVIVAGAAELVGPVPQELQFYNRFAGGVGSSAKEADAARALLALLTSPAAAPMFKARGMEPGTPK